MHTYAISIYGRFTGDYVSADTRREAITRYVREQGIIALPVRAERVQ